MRHRASPRPQRYVSAKSFGMRHQAFPARCEHHACRCRRAAELAAMGRTLDAIRCHYEQVPCRAQELTP